MRIGCKNTIIALTATLALGAAPIAFSQTGGHQGHETKPQGKQSSTKMSMPAMDDGRFVEMMQKHHQDGIELAKLQESRGSREDVKTLAAKIRQGQERDLEELKTKHAGHATTHPGGSKPQGTSGHAGHDTNMQKHHEMMEQMAQESKRRLETASGGAIDDAFLQEMAKHHQMALEMINKTKFKDAELRKLSQKMAAEQKQELQQIKKLQSASR